MRKIIKNILFAFVLPLAVFFSGCDSGDTNGHAEYKVSYYLQNVENDEYTLLESENFTGYEGEMTNISPKTIEGFSVVDFNQRKVSDGMDFAIKYNRNIITCNLNFNGGTVTLEDGTVLENTTVTGRFGAKIEVDEPEKTGYVLECYYMPDGTELGETFSKSGTYTASYIAKSESSYRVHHFLQNIENDEYTEDTERLETLPGFNGKKTEAEALEIEGFTAKAFEQKVVAADGSTEINVYYNRNLITFSFNLSGGDGQTSITKKYGSAVTVQNPVKNGAEFSGWTPDLPQTFTEDSTFTAVYDMPSYKVKYLFENLTDDGYSEDEAYPAETYLGTVGQTTNIAAKPVKGFVPQAVEQKTILADNSTIVEVKYTRRLITIFIDLKKGVGTNYIQGKFSKEDETEVSHNQIIEKLSQDSINTPQRIGFVFNGFDFATDLSFTLENNNQTLITVRWNGGEQVFYSVKLYKEKLEHQNDLEKYELYDTYYFKGPAGDKTGFIENSNDFSISLNGHRWNFEGFEPKNCIDQEIEGNETTVINLYFDRKIIKLHFDLNGIEFEGKTDYIDYTGRYGDNIPGPYPHKKGWTTKFTWNPDGTDFDTSKTTFQDKSGTIDCSWQINKYKIRLHNTVGRAAESEEYICEIEQDFGTTYKFQDNYEYKKLGFTTDPYTCTIWGWCADSNQKTVDYVENDIIAIDEEKDIDLYAIWTVSYQINYYDSRNYYMEQKRFKVPFVADCVITTDYFPTGYKFLRADNYYGQPPSRFNTSTSMVNVEKKRTKATFNLNGGTAKYSLPADNTYEGTYNDALNIPEIVKDNYTLTWVPEFNGKYPPDDTTYNAVWTPTEYTCTFKNLNTSQISSDNVKFTYFESKALSIKPAMDGFIFDGWYKDVKLKEPITEIPYGTSGDIEVYAKWIPLNPASLIGDSIKRVGDIALTDGKFINIVDGLGSLPDGVEDKVMAVITHQQSSKWRGMGLNISEEIYWQHPDRNNYQNNFYTLSPDHTDGYYSLSSIRAQDSGYNKTNYPAFGYADNYGSDNFGSDTTYKNWYLASDAEFGLVYQNIGTIKQILDLLGKDILDSKIFWTCNYDNYRTPHTWDSETGEILDSDVEYKSQTVAFWNFK